MAWSIPKFSKSDVDKAGAALLADQVTDEDFQIVDNWRSSHNYPLNFFQNDLRRQARAFDANCIVAQRIKRLSSITDKLRRFKTTRLSQMQDIGGCRAVLKDIQQVYWLAEKYRTGDLKTALVAEKDYIDSPKSDGYRAIHLVYKYAATKNEFHGLKIEMQLRSAKQHAWATAVETVALFTHQALKSNKGYWKWRRFFASMASAIAAMEKGNLVPNTDSDADSLKLTLRDYVEELNVVQQLLAYEKALTDLPNYQVPGDHYFLLLLNPEIPSLQVWGYKKNQLQQATNDYLDQERSIRGSNQNAVLVSAGSATDLRKAYPNYFLDTTAFLNLVRRATS